MAGRKYLDDFDLRGTGRCGDCDHRVDGAEAEAGGVLLRLRVRKLPDERFLSQALTLRGRRADLFPRFSKRRDR